jgi:tellurite resistance protein TerC
MATPLLAVLVLIEVSDVIFAVDSVLTVSREQLIVFASNAFAILGLRALYFLLALSNAIRVSSRLHSLINGLKTE